MVEGIGREDDGRPTATCSTSLRSPEPVPVSARTGDDQAHTPGPWLVNPAIARVEIPMADAPICALLWPTDLRSEDETFANGRLIAAAPDLLAFAKQIAARNPLYAQPHERPAIAEAIALVTKALGK